MPKEKRFKANSTLHNRFHNANNLYSCRNMHYSSIFDGKKGGKRTITSRLFQKDELQKEKLILMASFFTFHFYCSSCIGSAISGRYLIDTNEERTKITKSHLTQFFIKLIMTRNVCSTVHGIVITC